MRKLFLILMTLCAVSWGLSAQVRYQGTVVDAGNNEPLIGVTVMPIGGGQGAATDVDGKFTLNLPSSVKSVKVSYVGYKEQTVALHDKMVIRLASSSTNLDDVVVVAYGTANKESLTGSVAVVGSGDIEERPVTSVTSALEGSAPGVSVNNSTSAPGSAPTIRIRGFNSFSSGSQSPLYVVDGLIYEGSIAEINPADVESMSVLKDAASCALYGSRGANGVVLITTKKAKGQGKVDVNFQMNFGAYTLALPLYDRLGTDNWMEASLRAKANGQAYTDGSDYESALALVAPKFIDSYCMGQNVYGIRDMDGNLTTIDPSMLFDPATGKIIEGAQVLPGYNDLDWWKAITQTGFRQEYNLNAAGATEKFDIFASIGYLKQNGYVIESDYERFTARLNANFRPVSYFKAGINLSGSYVKSQTANVSSASLNSTVNPFQTMYYAPINPIYEHDATTGEIITDASGKPVYAVGGLNGMNNLIWETYENDIRNESVNLDGSVYGTAILPYGFEVTVRGGMYRYKSAYNDYSTNLVGSQKGAGGLDEEFDSGYSYTFTQQLNWSHEYGLNHIDALLLHQNFKTGGEYSWIRMSGQKLNNMHILSNFEEASLWAQGIDNYATESYLGRVRYNYDQKYFGEFSINRDGSSQFHPNNRWGTFWSVGASWIISKEKFMHDVNWINYLKLRAAYGSVGNNAAAGYYAYMDLYDWSGSGSLVPSQIGAPDLKWEATKTLDIALEGSLFNDRFNFSIGYFDKRNSDLIYSYVLPLSNGTLGSGYNPSILMNIGEMQNYGFELQFGVDIIRNANLKWDFNLDASFITNRIKQLPDGHDIVGSALFIGKSRYENYTYEWAGVDQLTGRSVYAMNPDSPDFYTYNSDGTRTYNQALWDSYLADAKADGTYVQIDGKDYTYTTSHAGRKIMSSSLPVVYGSFGTSLNWKGINFGLLFTYSLGGQVYDSNYQSLMSFSSQSPAALHKDVLNAWTEAPEGMTADSPNRLDKNAVPQLNSQLATENDATSSRFLTSANYLSLKNVNLSYDLPRKWVNALKLQNINVGFQMENVFITASRKGLNAQAAQGGSGVATGAYYQPARTYTFQLAVKF
ncbi:MAG: SusC/RagA family TonB-linked outer membrane protein [Lepagella sp.]